MATNTILKSLETTPVGEVQNYRQTETFIVGTGGVTLGDFVAYDFTKGDLTMTKFVVRSDLGITAAQMCIGVALASAAAGEKVEVCVRGVCEGKTLAIAAAGAPLCINGLQGAAATATAANIHPVVAYAKDTSAGTGVHTVVVVGN